MSVIFKREDFTLCDVPVPKGYPQSQTHSGIALWGEKYYLTTSPFPAYPEKRWKGYAKSIVNKFISKKIFKPLRAEAYENPCLYIAKQDSQTPPVQFKLMQEHPLMECPDDYYGLPAFNSDPDIYAEEGKLYILNRPVYRTKLCPGEPLNKYENRIYLISGEIDGKRFKLEKILRLFSLETRLLCSPCFLKYKESYRLLELETNSYNDGRTFDGIYVLSSQTCEGLKDNENWQKIGINNSDYLPWHMSVFQYQNRLYAIIACVKKGEGHRCWQMFGDFDEDLTSLTIYNTPLTDYKSYRGAACVTPEGEFVLYSTTVHEQIKGSKAVDGRDVIMAHMPFKQLLETLRKNEYE